MGSYTPKQRLYKVDPEEIVDPETNLNYNWRKLDDSIKHLIEWAPTDAEFISSEEDISNGRKFLKRRNNATMIGWNGTLYQDMRAYVNGWTLIPTSAFNAAWEHVPNAAMGRMMYTIDSDGDISLRGTMRLKGGAAITAKTTYDVLTLPTAARPIENRYYFRHMGNADAPEYAVNRFLIGSSGGIQIVRYGGDQGNANERYITFSGISFPRDVGF